MKKKKILFVSTRSPFSNIFSGDRYRAKIIIEHLRKKNIVEVLYSDELEGDKKSGIKKFFFKRNSIERIINTILCLITFKPLQLGFFYSSKVKNFLVKNHKNYNTIIFHLIRSAQYLPNDFKGKKILEMTDLLSFNYDQVVRSLSILNPLMYIYLLEKHFVKRYENKCIDKFSKIVLISKKDLNKKVSKKFIEIPNFFKIKKNIYKFKKKNNKILFIGNLNYLPNNKACKNFTSNILPEINKVYPKVQFHIIGEINQVDRIYFNKIENTFAHGSIKNLDPLIKNAICGICNLNIATGLQNKILTYVSNGLPCVANITSHKNTLFKKGKEILVYKNTSEFIDIIKKLKNNKSFSEKISRFSYSAIKNKYSEKKIFSNYDLIV